MKSKTECRGCEITKYIPSDHILELTELSIVSYCKDPVVLGHLVIQPRRHIENLIDLRADELADIVRLVCKYSNALLLRLNPRPERIYLCIFGEDPNWHLHFHLIPRDNRIPKRERGPSIFLRKASQKELSERSIQATIDKIMKAAK